MIIKIGRSNDNDYVISNMTVSRRHAELEITDGHIVIKDNGSGSGTYVLVQGKLERTTYKQVSEHDIIVVGNERLIVGEIIANMSKRNRDAVYKRNPLTGEVVKK